MAITPTGMETFKTTLPCVDAHVTTNNQVVQQGKTYDGKFTYVDDDHVRFVEKQKKAHVIHPELHWRLLERTKHGRMHTNVNHIKVEFYIKHGEYVSEQQLADMLAREIEQMGESLCDMDLKSEVEACC